MFNHSGCRHDDEYYLRKQDRRRENIMRSAKEPMLPGFSTFFYLFTIIGTLCSVLAETVHFFQYVTIDFATYLRNVSLTAMCFWLLFGLTDVLLSYIRRRALQKHPETALKRSEDDTPGFSAFFRPKEETPELYLHRIRICLGGGLLLVLFFAVVHL